jgi:hypothetical protein
MEMGRERRRSPTRRLRPAARERGRSRPTVCAHLVRRKVSRSVLASPPDFVHDLPDDLGHELPDNPSVEYAVRNQIGLDVALEALTEAWRSKRLNIDELNRIAKKLRVYRVMQPYLETVVL